MIPQTGYQNLTKMMKVEHAHIDFFSDNMVGRIFVRKNIYLDMGQSRDFYFKQVLLCMPCFKGAT